ncbi:MAG: DUF4400 domain-containing protein [Rhodocyclaceae bacterium]|nr:MAG: DUF4400 domain-containing protein [Rhodocyclaceae bacterium]
MPKHSTHQSSGGSFLFGLVVLGVALTAALMPASHVQRVLADDRASVQALLPEDEDEEALYGEARLDDADDPLRDAYLSDGEKINAWARDRVVTLTIWGQIINYRFTLLYVWLLVMLPLLMASFIDGYLVREGRKYIFQQQSSVRHRAGVKIATGFAAVAGVSLLLPLHVWPLLMPMALGVMAIAAWVWVSNLQKRI